MALSIFGTFLSEFHQRVIASHNEIEILNLQNAVKIKILKNWRIFYKSGVFAVWPVHRSTWIFETPGYDHLGAGSNVYSREDLRHNPTIWLNNKPYFIYELGIASKNEKEHRVGKKMSDFFVQKRFSWFFSDLTNVFSLHSFSFKLHEISSTDDFQLV